jgi:hypothetical protein
MNYINFKITPVRLASKELNIFVDCSFNSEILLLDQMVTSPSVSFLFFSTL